MASITGSVGQGGTNRYEDVRVVQGALNRFPDTAGGPNPKLDTDGGVGSRTINAIKKFQGFFFPSHIPDGRVDVGKRAHGKLEAGGAQGVTEVVGTVLALSQLDDRFIAGFISGVASALPGSLGTELVERVRADPLAFLNGYKDGYLSGLVAGLRNLAISIRDIFRLAIAVSPPVLAYQLVTEVIVLLTDATHRELRHRQVAEARVFAAVIEATLRDLAQRPDDYLALSGEIGSLLGAQFALVVGQDLLSRDARRLGELAGSIVGQIVFEVIVQVLLALATEGVGNAARAGVALGGASQGATRFSALAARLRPVLSRLPGLERLFALLARERQAQGALRVDAAISAAVEAAFAEGAQFEVGVMRLIRVRDPRVVLSAEQIAGWRNLRTAQGLPEEFAQVWRTSSNQAATDGLAEVRRLWALGDDASRLEARRLGRIIYNNWRNRFMGQLRQPANAALRARIERAGFRLSGGTNTSPRLAGGSGEALTLDHSRRLMEDPTRCVDPTNLEFVIGYENSVTLEQLRNLTSADMF